MFDPIRFINPSYLFNPNPGSAFPSFKLLIIILGLLLVIAICIFVLLRVKKVNTILKRLLKPIPLRLEIFSLVGLLLVLFRMSGAYYLSMRFLLVIWGVVFIIYLVSLSKKIKEYPTHLQEFTMKEEMKKYSHHHAGKKKK